MLSLIKTKRALLSVSDKTGIVELARNLHSRDVQILSTGGTATLLKNHDIPVIDVCDFTGCPEIMDGRVKTLHPKIHGGILGRLPQDQAVMNEQQILPIDLVVVNLYPFSNIIFDDQKRKQATFYDEAIENIDIGGPAMLRAAAKNHQRVTVVVDPADYPTILNEIYAEGGVTLATRRKLAGKVFSHTASYDALIAQFFQDEEEFPTQLTLAFEKKQDLRYGENPHQQAAFYQEKCPMPGSMGAVVQLQGKDLSFNNIVDSDAAMACVNEFGNRQACVIVKHANPCGVALMETQLDAYDKAWSTDKTSAFGGVIAFNQLLLPETVNEILKRQFVEVIIAPQVHDDVLSLVAEKPNIRLLKTGYFSDRSSSQVMDYKRVSGGLLVQEKDNDNLDLSQLKIVSKRLPTDEELEDLNFAWIVAKHVKSNAIVLAKNQRTIGVGAGQMSRVYSLKIAGIKAQDESLTVAGSVLASDAFFPFRDSIDACAQMGITAIIQPGGSLRDQEVIQAVDEANLAMVFTGMRHFKH